MSLPWKQSILIAVLGGVSCLCASGQDSPSLGDAARQARQQKQSKGTQTKSGTATAAATSKVITNDDIAGGSDAAGDASAGGKNHGSAGSAHSSSSSSSSGSSSGEKMSGEAWKSQIQGQKQAVNALQANLDNLNDSIHFTTGNCVSGCVQWNEHQQQKQQEVERMRAQLEQQKQQLHDMQESARQQGYGSSVYDP